MCTGAYAEREGKYGPGVGPIYLDDVKCSGSESHLLECPQLPLSAVHNCDHTEDATAVCPGQFESVRAPVWGCAWLIENPAYMLPTILVVYLLHV